MKNLDYARSYHSEINLKLDNIKSLLNELGNPQDCLSFVHVAGTNGKGSVCAFLEEILVASGRKTGRFSSPELIKRNETIRVDKQDISDDDLNRILMEVHNAAEKLCEFPSPYEILCAAAFLRFKEAGCDIVVLETGMGGEGDATNIVINTKISLITSISSDHTAYLGETTREIAKVKSGIIKPHSVFVTTEKNRDLFPVFYEKTEKINISNPFESIGFEDIYEKISYSGKTLKLSMGGVMQLENASLAVKAAELMGIDENSIEYGLENAKISARLEKISDNIYFDGAHNPAGAAVLKASIERYFKNESVTLIMGVMRDKDFSGMLDVLKGENIKFIFNTVKGNERAMRAEDMVATANKAGIKAEAVETLKEGIFWATGKVIVCGSLYMYRETEDIRTTP